MTLALLDRRVHVISDDGVADMPLSALRDQAYVVLLGEPGLGKSTALAQEADAEGASVITCREAMNGTPLLAEGTLFLDALDEFRSGENAKDKLIQLASALATAKIGRWRLTCRAEDWRDVADLRVMARAAPNDEILVAHLRPLREEEAVAVLDALGEGNPHLFLQRAAARGASAFLESPLSLRLLHSAVVADGVWPESRFDLFERAINALAHEHDSERVIDPNWGVHAIVDAASKFSFCMLASGAEAVWRANSMAPRDHLSLHTLNLPQGLAEATLDTALFRGEGHAFVPFHRTVGEYLAGRYLAGATVGNSDKPAFPLRRAIALITARDQKAPSELRGLYAWFAAHLHKQGDRLGALRLIERDAATVLTYGDAAAFDTEGRRAILVNLDRDDPYFLSSNDETTVLGGLASEDLSELFAKILDEDDRPHVRLTVMQALSDGPVVPGMQAKLLEIVLDPERPLWLRERAGEVRVKSAINPTAELRSLLSALAAMPLAPGQVMLRTNLMAGAEKLTAQDIRGLLTDFASLPPLPEDDDMADRGALSGLGWSLRKLVPADLFDRAIVVAADIQQRPQILSFIDQALTAAIAQNPDLSAERLWTWVQNVRENAWDVLDGSVVEAIGDWMDVAPSERAIALFTAIARTDTEPERPWVAVNQFLTVTRRALTTPFIEGLLEVAEQETEPRFRQMLFHRAAYCARGSTLWPAWKDRIVTVLREEPDNTRFIADLLADPNAKYKRQEAKRLARLDAKSDRARAQNIASMTPQLGSISAGSPDVFGILAWAADHYRNAMISDREDPLTVVARHTSPEIAAAIAAGMMRFAAQGDLMVDAERLGQAEAKLGSFRSEFVVAAGMHQALSHGLGADLDLAPIDRALVGLRQDYMGGDGGKLLSGWSTRRLGKDLAQGADLMVRYWNSALDAGDDDLDGLGKFVAHGELEFVRICILELLNTRPDLPQPALRQALVAASQVLTEDELAAFAAAHGAMANLSQNGRDIWRFVGLALDPDSVAPTIAPEELEAVLLAPSGALFTAMQDLTPKPDRLDLIRAEVLGRAYDANEDDWRGTDRPSAIVKSALKRLSASKAVDAGDELKARLALMRPSWAATVAHAAAEHDRMIRDDHYLPPDATELLAALAGGPPAGPADLKAIVLEELERYRAGLRTESETPWKRFWNTDQNGAATTPQIENEDRDRLLELLRTRFERYRIVAGLPEARRGENTRVDILLLSHAGKNLPIEVKRHYNRELWTAPVEQLGMYAADVNAHGFGVYLVFWFGTEFPLPARIDHRPAPTSAKALEALLHEDIPSSLRERLAIVVLDVARPADMVAAVARRNRGPVKKKPAEKLNRSGQ